jgi:hypothetical protein
MVYFDWAITNENVLSFSRYRVLLEKQKPSIKKAYLKENKLFLSLDYRDLSLDILNFRNLVMAIKNLLKFIFGSALIWEAIHPME